jgi:hypothetical protein
MRSGSAAEGCGVRRNAARIKTKHFHTIPYPDAASDAPPWADAMMKNQEKPG